MKFNFEKHIKKEEPKPKENPELTQEQFDEQILAEAQKLGTNLEQFKTEIDQYGGVEKFKEYFESRGKEDLSKNKAGETLSGLSSRVDYTKEVSKDRAKIAALCYGISALAVALGIHEGAESSIVAGSSVGGLMFLLSSGMLISSIKQKINARKLNRQKKKEELKFKMTGTEVK